MRKILSWGGASGGADRGSSPGTRLARSVGVRSLGFLSSGSEPRAAGLGLALLAGISLVAGGCASELQAVAPDPRPGSSMHEPADTAGFYGALADAGTWADSDWGDLWCPSTAQVGADFTPYTRGHFEYGEDGWTWVGDLPMSWAVEHYGRWVELDQPGCDWGWIPDGEWAPAWVDFEVGDGVIAWSPTAPDEPSIGHPKVRVAAPAQVRLAMAHLARPTSGSEHFTRVASASTPGAIARTNGGGKGKSGGDGSSSSVKIVVVVKEADFLAPDIYPVALRGPTMVESLPSLQPAQSLTSAQLRGEPTSRGAHATPSAIRASFSPGTRSPSFGGRAWSSSGAGTARGFGHGGGASFASGGGGSLFAGGGRSSSGHSSSGHSSSSHSSSHWGGGGHFGGSHR
jgi:hypothetical protein